MIDFAVFMFGVPEISMTINKGNLKLTVNFISYSLNKFLWSNQNTADWYLLTWSRFSETPNSTLLVLIDEDYIDLFMVLFISIEVIMMGIHIKTTLPILALLFLRLAAGQDELIVSTDKGKVRGLRLPLPGGSEYVAAFLGIPYAKPPLDQLRFRQPEPAEEWNGIRDATRYSNSCFQEPDTLYPGFPGAEMWNPNTRISEDCLYLNVWTPSTDLQNRAKPLVPVMVWIYGGGFSTGTASLDVYDGRFLSHSEQVVVVSMNYRVGALGFLSLPESESIKGNAGLFDQRLALSWVSRNIAAFGGDPSSATLFGESAGAGCVGHHLLSQGSHGLFTRAILQSGSPNAVWAAVEPTLAWNRSLTLAQLLNCPLGPSADEMEACLRVVEPEKIVSSIWSNSWSRDNKCAFSTNSGRRISHGHAECLNPVGAFSENWTSFGIEQGWRDVLPCLWHTGFSIHNQSLINRDQFLAGVSLSLPGFSDIAREAAVLQYTDWTDEQSKPKNREALGWLVGDHYFSCPLLDFARRFVENGGSARLFLFNHRSSLNPWPGWMGVMHGDEIPFVFGIPLNQNFGFSKEEEALSRRIMEHWGNFARSG